MPGRALGVLSASALAVGGMVALAGPASAASVVKCGQVLKTPGTYTLATNIGPCLKNGVTIKGNDIVLDLGRHFITGSNATAVGPNEQVGVLFTNAKRSVVKNGTVQNFDAGVAIQGGSANSVTKVTAQNNINHANITGSINACNFGDGITVQDSSGNTLTNDNAFNNGPFSGMSIVGNADNNVVSGNTVKNNTASNQNNNFIGPDNSAGNGPCGPFSATPTGVGRTHQNIGIRIEGPGADGNQVLNNTSADNQLEGISIHGYVCFAGFGGVSPPGAPPVGQPNTGNLVQGNTVLRNGYADVAAGELLDGIGILRQGPFGRVTCGSNGNSIIGNTSSNNARDGIFVAPTGDPAIAAHNTVNQNAVNNNGRDGVHVDGIVTQCPAGQSNPNPPFNCLVPVVFFRPGSTNNTLISNNGTGNAHDDGFDGNPSCDQNLWQQNIFGTVNQPCVAANGGTGTVTGPTPVPPPGTP